jgi:hypothetical protein
LQSFKNDLGITWTQNLANLGTARLNRDTASMEFRFMEHQQNWQSGREIDRRAAAEDIPQKPAERKVLAKIGQTLGLSQGSTTSATAKSRTFLKNLFSVDELHVAFILSRPSKDRWRSILRAEHGRIDTAMVKSWTNIVGPACQRIWIWHVLMKMKTNPTGLNDKMRVLFMSRDTAGGFAHTEQEELAWSFDWCRWDSLKSALEFKRSLNHVPYPDTARPSSRRMPGQMEYTGYDGDFAKIRIWALDIMNINGTPTMVSLIDLKEGDYLGMVPGTLHLAWGNRDTHPNHDHKHCFQGPSGTMLDPTPGPLWPLVRDRKLQPGNVAILWQSGGSDPEIEDVPSFEFFAVVVRPISAFEPLIIDQTCMNGFQYRC